MVISDRPEKSFISNTMTAEGLEYVLVDKSSCRIMRKPRVLQTKNHVNDLV